VVEEEDVVDKQPVVQEEIRVRKDTVEAPAPILSTISTSPDSLPAPTDPQSPSTWMRLGP
jgi:hypothetical protein